MPSRALQVEISLALEQALLPARVREIERGGLLEPGRRRWRWSWREHSFRIRRPCISPILPTTGGCTIPPARSLAQQVKMVGGVARLDLPHAAIEMFEWDETDRTYYAVTTRKQGLVFGHSAFPAPPEELSVDLRPTYYDASIDGRVVRVVAVRLPSEIIEDEVTVQVAETLIKRTVLAREILVALILPQGILLVAAALNDLLVQLADAHAAQRRFIDNALQYGVQGEKVTVGVGTGPEITLYVEDDGPGIPPASREAVFDRFYRLPGSPGNGCGLGLAIVREIAQLHGATVNISDGESGRGTRIAAKFS